MLYFWLCWVFLDALRPSLVGAGRGGCSPVAAPGLLAVTSHRGARALGVQASVAAVPGLQSPGSGVMAHRLSCSVTYGIFPRRGSNPCLLHWQAGFFFFFFFTNEPPGKPCVWFLERPALPSRYISAVCRSGSLFLLDEKYCTAGIGLLYIIYYK